jgi:rRNA-processing protein FCF1
MQFGVDIFIELANLANRRVVLILFSPVYEEIKALSQKKGKQGKLAKAVLKYMKDKTIFVDDVIMPGESVDDFLLRVADEWKCPVATNDRSLRTRLRNINIPVIYLRQKSYLEVDGLI